MSPFALPGRPLTLMGRAMCLGLACLLAALLFVATRVKPDPRGYGTHEQLGLTPCAVRAILNIPCPTCGGTTSFAHFVRGDWRAAFNANSAAFVCALLATLSIPWLAASAFAGRLAGVVRADWLFIALVALVAVLTLSNWVIRILPALR